MPNHIRQGDVLFVEVNGVPEAAKSREMSDTKSLVIAYGEASGHHHRLAQAEGVEVLDHRLNWRDSELFVRVTAVEMPVVHEEHNTVTLPAGTYRVHQAREYDYAQEAARFVAD